MCGCLRDAPVNLGTHASMCTSTEGPEVNLACYPEGLSAFLFFFVRLSHWPGNSQVHRLDCCRVRTRTHLPPPSQHRACKCTPPTPGFCVGSGDRTQVSCTSPAELSPQSLTFQIFQFEFCIFLLIFSETWHT